MKRMLLAFLACCLVGCTAPAIQKEEAYKQAISAVEQVDVKALPQKEENYFLYMGRVTCQHCLIFAPKLRQVLSDTPTKVYYVDSEHSKDNEPLTQFRQMHDIKYVPFLGYFEKGVLKARLAITDDMPAEHIKAFITEHQGQ